MVRDLVVRFVRSEVVGFETREFRALLRELILCAHGLCASVRRDEKGEGGEGGEGGEIVKRRAREARQSGREGREEVPFSSVLTCSRSLASSLASAEEAKVGLAATGGGGRCLLAAADSEEGEGEEEGGGEEVVCLAVGWEEVEEAEVCLAVNVDAGCFVVVVLGEGAYRVTEYQKVN